MMYNENLHEEEQHLIQQIAEQTERGKIDWELTEYNPLSFLNEDKIDKNPAVICQSFSFEAIIGGSRYELDVMENIDVPSGMGDYTITLTRDETENYLKIEDALSFDCDRYECTPEDVAERFADSPIVRLCNAIIPATLGQEDLEEVFTWARFFNETGISAKLMNHPLTKLCEKLFDEHRLMDFHRCVLDVDYRNRQTGCSRRATASAVAQVKRGYTFALHSVGALAGISFSAQISSDACANSGAHSKTHSK